MSTTKKNVSVFERDIEIGGSYQYTKSGPYSSFVANKRLTDVTDEIIKKIAGLKTVLDAGCGDGTYTAELKYRHPELEFTGFDPAEAAIIEASKIHPECNFMVGDILDITSFPKSRFDLVIIRGVLHHLPTQLQALRNAAEIADYVLIIEPNGNNPIVKWIEKTSEYHIEHEEQSFSSRFLIGICRKSGLKLKDVAFVGFVPMFFPTMPSRVIYFFQPFLERIPGLARFFGGQIVVLATSKDT
jgi:SAM-dependent methyltransferase